MAGMFSNNYNLTSVDLSSFNMKNVTDTTNMFVRTASLKTIKTPKNVCVLRFAPIRLSAQQLVSVHSENEIIDLDAIADAVAFYKEFLKNI